MLVLFLPPVFQWLKKIPFLKVPFAQRIFNILFYFIEPQKLLRWLSRPFVLIVNPMTNIIHSVIRHRIFVCCRPLFEVSTTKSETKQQKNEWKIWIEIENELNEWLIGYVEWPSLSLGLSLFLLNEIPSRFHLKTDLIYLAPYQTKVRVKLSDLRATRTVLFLSTFCCNSLPALNY